MPEEVKKNAAEQAAQAQKQPVPMPTTYEALRHDLIASGRAYDFDMIDRAYQLASAAHATQFRRSGEPYICHPISVAQLLVELGMDSESVAAALMHDVAEDTPVTIDEIRQKFGSEVALLVDGVTKLTQIKFSNVEDRKAENLRKMLLAMSQDVRVMLIKLCDRLHNMRTGDAWPEQKRRDKALETMEVYAPIAHRLGISNIKEELEDRSLQYLDPVGYNMIRSLLNKHGDDFLNDICATIQEHLEQNGIHGATIRHRVKSIYGIYRKMYMQNKDFEEIYDIYAVRIIIDTVAECYTALGLIHDMYHPLPNRFKDYISTPKPNGYQSLHTTVIGREAIPFEVQIRTREMDRNAEYGIAAHWKYKAGITAASSDRLDERLAWVRQLLESQRSSIDATDLLSDIKSDLLPEEVFAFTPRGDVINLPAGATVIDYAYAIHSAVGNRMIGAKVNNRIVPIDHQVVTGEIIEIITGPENRGPSRDWLNIVKTSEAKNKIRNWFKKERRDENIAEGKDAFEKELRRNLMVPTPSAEGGDRLTDAWLERCDEIARGVHYREEVPVRDLFETDLDHMLPLPPSMFDACDWRGVKADRTGTVTIDSNRYLAGPKWHSMRLMAGVRALRVELRSMDGEPIVTLERRWGRSPDTAMDPLSLLAIIARKPRSWGESPIRSDFPEETRVLLDRMEPRERGLLVDDIRHAAVVSGFRAAVMAVVEIVAAGRRPDRAAIDQTARRIAQGDGPESRARLDTYSRFMREDGDE